MKDKVDCEQAIKESIASQCKQKINGLADRLDDLVCQVDKKFSSVVMDQAPNIEVVGGSPIQTWPELFNDIRHKVLIMQATCDKLQNILQNILQRCEL
jgi:hypothetical protein